MDWDDSYDEEWDDATEYGDRDYNSAEGKASTGSGDSKNSFDPLDIANPVSAYFFLSDDAQDEIEGAGRRRTKCTSCGHRFMGETYDSCPKCDSLDTEEVLSFIDDDEGDEAHNMKCLSCGQTFVGEEYDQCPECFSMDTEEINDRDESRYW